MRAIGVGESLRLGEAVECFRLQNPEETCFVRAWCVRQLKLPGDAPRETYSAVGVRKRSESTYGEFVVVAAAAVVVVVVVVVHVDAAVVD